MRCGRSEGQTRAQRLSITIGIDGWVKENPLRPLACERRALLWGVVGRPFTERRRQEPSVVDPAIDLIDIVTYLDSVQALSIHKPRKSPSEIRISMPGRTRPIDKLAAAAGKCSSTETDC